MSRGYGFEPTVKPSAGKGICIKEINPACLCLKCRAARGLTEADNPRLERAAAELLAAHPAEAPAGLEQKS